LDRRFGGLETFNICAGISLPDFAFLDDEAIPASWVGIMTGPLKRRAIPRADASGGIIQCRESILRLAIDEVPVLGFSQHEQELERDCGEVCNLLCSLMEVRP